MGFEDLEDLSELDEMPPFEEDLTLPDFDEEPGGGVSRTFKIVGALLVLLVVGIVAVLVWWALQGSNEPSPNERTSTAIVAMNATTFADATRTQEAYQATLEALSIAATASQEAIATFEFYSTQTQEAALQQEIQRQTQAALDAAATATAEADLIATAFVLTQTQAVSNANLTATAIQARSFSGQVIDEAGNIFGGVILRLYRDDGDGIFNPADEFAVSGASQPNPGSTPQPGTPQTLVYGDTVNDTLEREAVDLWRFEGRAGDVVTIEAIAGNPAQMDMFLVLLGPNQQPLTDDDDSGEELNAMISGYTLPQDGIYTIQVSSVSGPGPYTLRLTGNTSESESQGALPRVQDRGGIRLVQLGAPSPTPIPGGGDTFITFTETDLEGQFQFEDLDPGIYWLVIDYDSLPESIKALIPRTEELVIMVTVPVTGRVTFTVGVPPTATPDDSIFRTQTAIATLTVSPEAIGTPTPEATASPTTGPDLTATLERYGLLSDFGATTGLEGGSGLTVLAIAAAGLVAVVFIARKLRTAA